MPKQKIWGKASAKSTSEDSKKRPEGSGSSVTEPEEEKPMTYCFHCRKNLNDPDLKIAPESSRKYLTEIQALDKLKVPEEKPTVLDPDDNADYTVHIREFCIYDQKLHLCEIESGLIEKGVNLYMRGIVYKEALDESSDDMDATAETVSGAFWCTSIGPINEWSLDLESVETNYNLTVETDYAIYKLSSSNTSYKQIFSSLLKKTKFSKVVCDKIKENNLLTYKELVEYLSEHNDLDFGDSSTEKYLQDNAQFLCDRLLGLEHEDDIGVCEEPPYFTSPCIRKLQDYAFLWHEKVIESDLNDLPAKPEFQLTKPTLTSLVEQVAFDERKQEKKAKQRKRKKDGTSTIKYFDSGKVMIGDCVKTDQGIGRVVCFVPKPEKPDLLEIHVQWLYTPSQIILGEETAFDENTLFLTNNCTTIPLSDVLNKVCVDFTTSYGMDAENVNYKHDCRKPQCLQSYLCNKMYYVSQARLEHLKSEFLTIDKKVVSCCFCELYSRKITLLNKITEKCDNHLTLYGEMLCRGMRLKIGDFILLKPGTCFQYDIEEEEMSEESEVDEKIYTEFYRKKNTKRSSVKPPAEPAEIGQILEIMRNHSLNSDVVKVRLIFRPANTDEPLKQSYKHDWNYVYWTDTVNSLFECDIETNLMAQCYVLHKSEVPGRLDNWINEGPNRFYFDSKYNPVTKAFVKTDSLQDYEDYVPRSYEKINLPIFPTPLKKPLKCLDLFAGCGGLMEGLCQAGVVQPCWAIEINEVEATSYACNFQESHVIQDDCNEVLKSLLKGLKKHKDSKLPEKDEVEMIIGGPPCQGFSQLNRNRETNNSKLKNDLVLTYLSYCDFFRPKYIIFENVYSPALFNGNGALQSIFFCLMKMDYEVTLDCLQSGNYGVPQSRNRIILLASKHGYKLPSFPNHTHAFSKKNMWFGKDYVMDEFSYAPFRSLTVQDAISDLPNLPEVPLGMPDVKDCYMFYDTPETHFQKVMKQGSRVHDMHPNLHDLLQDHIYRRLSPLDRTRIKFIPHKPNADWMDLPNKRVKYCRKSFEKLVYLDEKKKNVCDCKSSDACNNKGQEDTLIPFSLVHTASRNNNWKGVLGRLSMDEYFDTIVTNPHPMRKQGRVIHPMQDRVVTVREYARAQGFPDCFVFRGNKMAKYKQVGNAVPPPLAKAIGRSIIQAISESVTPEEVEVQQTPPSGRTLRSSRGTK